MNHHGAVVQHCFCTPEVPSSSLTGVVKIFLLIFLLNFDRGSNSVKKWQLSSGLQRLWGLFFCITLLKLSLSYKGGMQRSAGTMFKNWSKVLLSSKKNPSKFALFLISPVQNQWYYTKMLTSCMVLHRHPQNLFRIKLLWIRNFDQCTKLENAAPAQLYFRAQYLG